jgi:hypothetical protein
MRRISHTLIRAAALALLYAAAIEAQDIPVPSRRLASPVDTVRMNAFYQMAGAADDHVHHPERPFTSFLAARAHTQPALASALIALLNRENAVVASTRPNALPPGYLGDYYMTVKVTVARMKDPASVDALLAGTGNSGAIMDALISFGDAAVPGVLRQIQSTDPSVRNVAVATLRYMVEEQAQNHLSAASIARIVPALLLTARNPAEGNREDAIRGLMPLANPEIRPVMQSLASDMSPSLRVSGRPDRYGVSDAAKEWLARHPK